MKHRILVIAHGHPDFSLGGAEMAAYQFFKASQAHPEVEASTFLAAHGQTATGAIRSRRKDEYLWEQTTHGSFQFQAANRQSTLTAFRSLIEYLRPTTVFMHHYTSLGLETIRVLRDVVPGVKIIMTLHEMLAICNNNGQMVKTTDLRLCVRESPEECHGCFPNLPIETFWLRKQFIKSYFNLVDHFVTPSHFLRERYIEWGIPETRISTIENGQASSRKLPPRPLRNNEGRTRFGFFGQINPYKGIDLLLEAVSGLSDEVKARITVEINGANLEHQDVNFQASFKKLYAPLKEEGIVHFVGPYLRNDLPNRMARIDWLLVPSIWWENSPMVIQEAFALGRPVICSNIGGMAEKVRHGVDGWHVEARSVREWSEALSYLSSENSCWQELYDGITEPLTYRDCVDAHLEII
ncbi:MAG: glycosyltransferase family 4 protein [Massilia sp.]|uniref:glycosyltransferase family 4 protein n=1 Tax=Massilia sp. TaxID=1882437 RepID=UPI002FC7BA2A